jgi:hypothetical protein
MTASIAPVVRLMVVCDTVAPNPENPNKTDLLGVLSTLTVDPEESFPAVLAQMCVFLILTSGRGTGCGEIVVVDAESDAPVFGCRPDEMTFGDDPLERVGKVFRLLDCRFPSVGQFRVEFRYNDKVLAHQTIEVRRRQS